MFATSGTTLLWQILAESKALVNLRITFLGPKCKVLVTLKSRPNGKKQHPIRSPCAWITAGAYHNEVLVKVRVMKQSATN